MIFARLDLLQTLTDSCCGLSLEAEANVVGVGRGSILEHDLALDHRPREVLQVLQLVEAVVPEKESQK